MVKAFAITTGLIFAAHLSAVGGSHLICRMTGEVMDTCGCDDANRAEPAPQITDACCNEVHVPPADITAIVSRVAVDPPLNVMALAPAIASAAPLGEAVAIVSSFVRPPPRSIALYVLERQLLI
jgi:hypothetical protein